MAKSSWILGLLLWPLVAFGQVESLTINSTTRNVNNTGNVNFATGQLLVNSVTIPNSNWDTAFTDRLKWDGGSSSLVAATGRTSLGATTVGSNIFTLANPTSIRFIHINADNSIASEDAPTFRTSLGATTVGSNVFTIAGSPLATNWIEIAAGGAASLKTQSQMRTDLALVPGTDVQVWDTDLDTWATKTPYAGTLTITTAKTFNVTNTLTLSGTDGSTLNVGAGGTLAASAFTDTTNATNISSGTLATARGALPTGGTVNQLLIKQSSTNFATAWESFASAQVSGIANPTGTTSTAGVMMGMGGATLGPFVFTPTSSGKALLIVTGTYYNNTANATHAVQLRYGTGTAPANGAALTGTAGPQHVRVSAPANSSTDFTLTLVVTNLTVSTQIWVDIALQSGVNTQTTNATGLFFSAVELP